MNESQSFDRRAPVGAALRNEIGELVQDAAVEVHATVIVQPGGSADGIFRPHDIVEMIGLAAVRG